MPVSLKTAEDISKALQEAIEYRRNGDLDNAILVYQELIKFQPDNPVFYDRKAQAQAQKGCFSEAIDNYRQAISLGIENPIWTYKNLGDALREENKLEEAELAYSEAIQVDSSNPFVYDCLGQIQAQKGNFAEAIGNYRQAISLGIENPTWTYKNLENALKAENRIEEAESVHEQLLKVQSKISISPYTSGLQEDKPINIPTDPDNKWLMLHNQGDDYFKQQKWEDAIASYQQAIELNPDYFWSYYNFGRSLLNLEKWNDAMPLLQKAAEQNNNFADVYSCMGTTFLNIKKWNDAILYFKKAIDLDENLPSWVYESLGEALSHQTNTETLRKLKEEEQDLIQKHPLPHKIFLPTEKISIEDRVEGLKKVIDIYDKWNLVYQPQLKQLKEKYKGVDRCFIIGNGPSLNLTDLGLLKDEVTFGVNGIFLKSQDTGFSPTFYVVEDHLVAEDRKEAINNFKGSTKLFPINLAYCFDEADDTIFYDHRPRKSYPDGYDFSMDASECTYTGCTVTFSCMQLAYHLGIKNIYLIGVDCSYDIPEDVKVDGEYDTDTLDMDSDDINHFHPDYFGKGYRWHDPQVDKMREAYREARRVCNETGVNMYNATIGGKLEVFPRIDYYSLFDFNKIYPRVLIIDMTKLGSISATGQIKQNLFAEWSKPNILQVYSIGEKGIGLFSESEVVSKDDSSLPEETVFRECLRFNPQLIYYRPVADKPHLHDFACQLIDALKIPVVTHIMDDWLERLKHQDSKLYTKWDSSIRTLLEKSAARLSISEAMSEAFLERYGLDFTNIANCIEPQDWLLPKHDPNPDPSHKFTIRYVGGLADDMNFQSITDLANVVSDLADTLAIELEICTGSYWLKKAVDSFDKLPSISIIESNFSQSEYRRLLMTADALVIAYNFDIESINYVRYSMANKLPECLASATPILVYGSEAIATVAYAGATETVLSVTEQNPEKLRSAILELAQNPQLCRQMGHKARKYAFQNHSGKHIRHQLHTILRTAISKRSASQCPHKTDESQILLSKQMIVTDYNPEMSLLEKINYLEQQNIKKTKYQKHLNQGKKLLEQDQLDEAVVEFKLAAKCKSDEYEVYFFLGEILARRNQIDEAMESYQKSVELKNDYPWSLRGLADSLEARGNLEQAIYYYRKSVEAKPGYFYAQQRLANTYKKQGDLENAIAAYRRALELKPDSSAVHQALDECLAESSNT